MQYWKIKLSNSDVFYKTPIKLSKVNVPREAVIDGDLLDVFLPSVQQVEEISSEVYHEYMND